MEPQQWESLQAIFIRVADLPREQQRTAVAEACSGDFELEREVLELLEEDASGHRLLDAGLAVVAGRFLESEALHSLVQRQIGPYRLLRLLGEGGMGVVYLAERTDIGGLVAIKLLRDAWMSPMRRDRFLAEQRTMARLNHRGITHIYDAGTMMDGTPWFVMEFADGLPITEYLLRRHASATEILQLFRQVCEAVQHAHGLGVIHRDLKPSNILVTKDGEVKLLDFGIAKTLDFEGDDPRRTVEGLRLMSPAYAAPEQRSGGAVGVFTDIYALGVLLYELLTGILAPADHGAGRPPRPSLAAKIDSTIDSKIDVRPATKGLDRHQWADLDFICSTALQPDWELRYRSVDAMARDAEAYLECRPLEGRRNGAWYAAGKFVFRHRIALMSGALVLAILTAAAVVATVRIAAARNSALSEAARANRLLDFTEELFDGGDPQAGPHVSLKVIDILERGRQEALNLPSDTPLKNQLLTLVGTAYGKLGQMQTADQLLEKAHNSQAMPGTRDGNSVKSILALAELRREERRLPEAEQLSGEAFGVCERQQCDKSLVERAHADLGSALALSGRYQNAKAELDTATRMHRSGDPPNTQYSEDLTQLAEVDHYLGDYVAAKALNQQALAINLALRGKNHPAVAENLNNLSAIALNNAEYDQAEQQQREALAIMQNWYGPDHPAVADQLSALASVLIARNNLQEGEASLKRALAIEVNTYGEKHASVALTYNELGLLALQRNQEDVAEKDFRSAMTIWQQVYGPNHQFVALAYSNLASVYSGRKNYTEAESLSRKALAIYSSVLPGENVNTAVAHIRLGRVLIREGKFSDAKPETQAGYKYFAEHDANSAFFEAARKDLAQIERELRHPKLSAQPTPAAPTAQSR